MSGLTIAISSPYVTGRTAPTISTPPITSPSRDFATSPDGLLSQSPHGSNPVINIFNVTSVVLLRNRPGRLLPHTLMPIDSDHEYNAIFIDSEITNLTSDG
jgi:hypothetical protein